MLQPPPASMAFDHHPCKEGQGLGGAVTPTGCFAICRGLSFQGPIRGAKSLVTLARCNCGMGLTGEWGSGATAVGTTHASAVPLHPAPPRSSRSAHWSRGMGGPAPLARGLPSPKQVATTSYSPTLPLGPSQRRSFRTSKGRPRMLRTPVGALAEWQTRAGHSQPATVGDCRSIQHAKVLHAILTPCRSRLQRSRHGCHLLWD